MALGIPILKHFRVKHLKFTTHLKFYSIILDPISQNFGSKPSVSFTKN